MPVLHMETEAIHQQAQQLAQSAEQLYQQVQGLDSSLQHLRSSWFGGSCNEFQQEMDQSLRKLRRLAAEAYELSGQLRREVQEWETIDRTGMYAFKNVL